MYTVSNEPFLQSGVTDQTFCHYSTYISISSQYSLFTTRIIRILGIAFCPLSSFSKSIWNHNSVGVHPVSLCSMLLLSRYTAAVSNTLHKNVYWNMCNCKYNTYLCVRGQNMFWLDSTYIWKLGSWSSLHMFS